jgi:beta-mannanase
MLTGIYDSSDQFNNTDFDIDHNFVDWRNTDEIKLLIKRAQEKNRVPLLTIEPMPDGDPSSKSLLPDIISGKYDQVIINMSQAVASSAPQTVIIRWGHEMDLCTVYPWSICNPNLYIPCLSPRL